MKEILDRKDWEMAKKSAENQLKESAMLKVSGDLLYNKAIKMLEKYDEEEPQAK